MAADGPGKRISFPTPGSRQGGADLEPGPPDRPYDPQTGPGGQTGKVSGLKSRAPARALRVRSPPRALIAPGRAGRSAQPDDRSSPPIAATLCVATFGRPRALEDEREPSVRRLGSLCPHPRRRTRPRPWPDAPAAAAVRRAARRADPSRQPGGIRGARGPLPVAPARVLPPHARLARGR